MPSHLVSRLKPLVRRGVIWLIMVTSGLSIPVAPRAVKAEGAAPLSIRLGRLGSLFFTTEPVEIFVETTGDRVEWTVQDFSGESFTGAPVQTGGTGRATVRPLAAIDGVNATVGRPGYYELRLVARRGTATLAETHTVFAVVTPPVPPAPGGASPFGTMTHFAQGWDPALLPLLVRVGVSHLRDEQYWANVEPTRGAYTFSPSYQAYMAAAAANGVEPLLEMTFDNPAYDHDPAAPTQAFAPFTEDGRRGYARYGRALLERYGAQVHAVEVWNEYNGSWCNGPAALDRPRAYAAMLADTRAELKAIRPDVRVVGGAAVLVPLPWFEDLFAAGAYPNLDAVAVHPYRAAPEGVETDLAALRDLMRRVSGDGTTKPIWVTECGSVDGATPGRLAMARYLVRMLTLLLSERVERIYWYCFKDHLDYLGGLVRGEDDPLGRYAPTAALAAYANLIRQFGNTAPEPLRREATDRRTRCYAFKVPGATDGGGELRVAWSLAPPSRLVLATDTPLTLVNIMGVERKLMPTAGIINLSLDENPVFLRGPVKAVREIGRDLLLADSVEDFGSAQGGAPGAWSYGSSEGAHGPNDFRPMTWTRTKWGYQWQSPAPYATLDAAGAHPGAAVWTVRRWRSSVGGEVRITGKVNRVAPGGDGTGAKVMVDGREVFSALVGGGNPESATLDVVVPVRVNGTVDFVVTPGPGTDMNFDAVEFRAQISQPVSPGPGITPAAAFPSH